MEGEALDPLGLFGCFLNLNVGAIHALADVHADVPVRVDRGHFAVLE